jgi:hypothetical protein
MKIYRVLPQFFIFSAFMLTGMWTGTKIGKGFQSPDTAGDGRYPAAQPTYPVPGISSSLGNAHTSWVEPSGKPVRIEGHEQGQHLNPLQQSNFLLIGVDRLDTVAPQLESIWLAMYLTDTPRVFWMPIHPTILPAGSSLHITADPVLASSFSLSSANKPSTDFLRLLNDRGLKWNGYIVVDKTALAQIIDFNNAETTGDRDQMNGAEIMAELPSAQIDSAKGLLAQANLIQEMCRSSMHLELDAQNWLKFYDKLADHLITDIEPVAAAQELLGLFANGSGLFCEFPSMMIRND